MEMERNNLASEQPKGFLQYFLRSHRVTFLVIVGLTLLGANAVLTLPREATPEVKVPFGIVTTVFPGASARDVEELVTDPLEQELESLVGVVEITSTSRLGFSSIGVEFAADEDIDESLRNLRDAVDKVRNLPTDAEDPQVIEVNFSNEPIISISLGGVEDERLLSQLAERLADEIETISNISSVTVIGARQEVVVVRFDPVKLSAADVSLAQLQGSLRANNSTIPLGDIETDTLRYELRVASAFEHVGDVAGVPIRTSSGSVVPLGTLAHVSIETTEAATTSRISSNGGESSPAVTLSVVKKTGGNVVDIVEEIQQTITEAQRTYLPDGIVVETFADRSEDVRRSLRDVSRSGVQTLLIVFGILWLFLGWQEAVITALAVPLTFAIAFVTFDITGTTLNNVSLFSLILSLGLLVDNAIVVIEGIHERPEGTSLRMHAGNVVDAFKKPLIGGTLTTVAAFFPMLLVSGIIGEFLRTIPIVVSSTLIASLFVALALIPIVAVAVLRRFKRQERPAWFARRFERFQQWYNNRLTHLLQVRRRQNIFIATMVLLLVAGLSLPFTGALPTGLFPAVDIDFIIINVDRPPGSTLETTDSAMREIETVLRQVPEVTSYVANVGASSSLDLGGGSSSEHLGSFFVNLDSERGRTSIQISDDLRGQLKPIHSARIVVEDIDAGPPTSAPVEARLVGPDLGELDRLSIQLMGELRQLEGAIDVDRNLRLSAGEFRFELNQDKVAAAGLTTQDVGLLVRSALFGTEVTDFLSATGDEVDVRLQARDEAVGDLNAIRALPLLTVQGEQLTLESVAEVELGSSINAIRRQDGERVVAVTANSAPGANANELTEALQERVDAMQLPEGYRVDFGGEQAETVETFNELYRSMIISVVLILIILVVEFNSYKQPWVIFLSIPLALIGVLFGLLITGSQLNFATFIGLVSLTGIVVNDAIILVDRMNNLRRDGIPLFDAVIKGCNQRLQPVVLTTLTTAGGVAPLIWVDEFFRDMALTIITGLIFASILTLVFIPMLYLRQQQKLERKLGRAAL